MQQSRIDYLWMQYFENKATDQEEQELLDMLEEAGNNEYSVNYLSGLMNNEGLLINNNGDSLINRSNSSETYNEQRLQAILDKIRRPASLFIGCIFYALHGSKMLLRY